MADPHDKSFLYLTLVVCFFGARFMPQKEREEKCPGVDFPQLESKILQVAGAWFLPSMQEFTVEARVYNYLLGSAYFIVSQTHAASVTVEATIKAAMRMGLHQEHTWKSVDDHEREVRRRLWWVLFITSGYVCPTKPNTTTATNHQKLANANCQVPALWQFHMVARL